MIPLYTISLLKNCYFYPCPKISTKLTNSCNFIPVYISSKSYFLSFQLTIFTILKDKNKTIKQICLYKEKNANNLQTNLSQDYIIHRHISYIKEYKLVTISYTINILKKPSKIDLRN